MNICLYGASSDRVNERCKDAVERLGEEIAKRGHTLIFGGGNHGMMGASARGAKRGGGRVIGIAPSFFDVDGVLFPDCDRIIAPETMHDRKTMLRDLSDAFVVTPGGIGTLDEFFEVLTLRQLSCHHKPIAIYNVAGSYDSMLRMFDEMIEGGYMKENCKKLYRVFTDPVELMDYVEIPIPAGQDDPATYKSIVLEKAN